eukprot:TRINITY_DN5476_c3_g1_i1.p1 TRINITY_DN5476_c3_g1~~TRINITY_DN5476_c3_g1_i1.p1  ORF type:complete len:102 (+),score=8.76 TRINITY_DN5476_c3_g1_i1:110-415(+)
MEARKRQAMTTIKTQTPPPERDKSGESVKGSDGMKCHWRWLGLYERVVSGQVEERRVQDDPNHCTNKNICPKSSIQASKHFNMEQDMFNSHTCKWMHLKQR